MQEDAATFAVLFGQKGRHETQHFTRGVRSSRISLEPEGLPPRISLRIGPRLHD
jgi:hypothetical protein